MDLLCPALQPNSLLEGTLKKFVVLGHRAPNSMATSFAQQAASAPTRTQNM